MSNKLPAPVVWFEIRVSDLKAAANFYGELFGWEFEPFAEYDSNYWIIKGDEKGLEGALVLDSRACGGQPGTVVFVAVESLEQVVRWVIDLGGTVVQEPRSITKTAGRFALVDDPQGNRIGLWSR